MKDDFAGIRAEPDDFPDFVPARHHAAPVRRGGASLWLQIALGLWLGGMALGITWLVVRLLLVKTGLLLLIGG